MSGQKDQKSNQRPDAILLIGGVIIALSLLAVFTVLIFAKKNAPADPPETTAPEITTKAEETTAEPTEDTTEAPENTTETPEETTAPETTEEETTEPETTEPETTAPEPSTKAPEPSTNAPVPTQDVTEQGIYQSQYTDAHGIRALTASELSEISVSYDLTGKGYGSGLTPGKDGYGRPSHNAAIDARMRSLSLSAEIFAAGPGTKQVSFMFMEGTEGQYGVTASVLDILKEKNVPATFFITHFYGNAWPSLVQRMIAEGHEVGSHTYLSASNGMARKPLLDQVNDALKMQDYVYETFHYVMRRYNPNDGVYAEGAVAAMNRMGYQVTLGSVQYDDWNQQKTFDKEDTLNKLKALLHDGAYYCFHSVNPITREVLPELIDYIRSQGYEIVRLP